jgi:hypothetical protein
MALGMQCRGGVSAPKRGLANIGPTFLYGKWPSTSLILGFFGFNMSYKLRLAKL